MSNLFTVDLGEKVLPIAIEIEAYKIDHDIKNREGEEVLPDEEQRFSDFMNYLGEQHKKLQDIFIEGFGKGYTSIVLNALMVYKFDEALLLTEIIGSNMVTEEPMRVAVKGFKVCLLIEYLVAQRRGLLSSIFNNRRN